MASKQKLLDMAIDATGDSEITVAGDFQPKGMTWKRAAGAAAGSAIGGAVSDDNSWAKAAGAAGGMALGSLASGASTHLPPIVVLAASPTKLYVLATKVGSSLLMSKHLEVLHVLNRDDLMISFKKRATVRTVVIHDESTGVEFKLEGVKLGFHHMNDLLNELEEGEHAEAEAATEARLAEADAAGE